MNGVGLSKPKSVDNNHNWLILLNFISKMRKIEMSPAQCRLIECIGSDVTREGLQRPVQQRTAHVSLRLFFPQPRPSFGGSQRAHTRGDHARDASSRGGGAGSLRPPDAPPCL